MESLYINRLTDIRPNTDCYKHVLRILSQSNPHHTHNPSNNNNNNNSNNNDDNNHHHMGKEASHLLLAMEERALLPDSDCFSYAIRTWCNHATASSIMVTENDNDRDQSRQRMRQERVMEEAGRADDLLGRMEEMYHRSSVVLVKPRTEDYNNVIRAWSRCVLDGAVQMAEKRLIKMENVSCDDDDDDDGSSGGTKDILPTAESYISVIHAYANNPTVTHKVDKAKIVLERMSKQYENGNTACKPTVESFNALISVCGSDAFATITTTSTTNTTTDDDKTKALTCAVETLNQMHRHKDRACRPNSNTYSLLLSAFGKLLSFEDRDANHIWNQQRGHTRKNHLDKAIESTFAKCCAEGLVDDSVIRTLQQVAPYDLYRSIVLLKATSIASNRGDGEVEGGLILPHEWTRNTARRGGRQYNIPLTVDGTLWNSSTVVSELKMRRLRSQNNKKLLQGGRM